MCKLPDSGSPEFGIGFEVVRRFNTGKVYKVNRKTMG
jgi:hypothetical protein